jgi:hypothetical protein
MSIQRAFLAAVLSVAVASAAAQETLSTDSTATMDSLSSTSLFEAPPPGETALVPIKGVVSGSPESVKFSGDAKVSSRHAADPDFNRPRLVLTIDLRGVAGVGSSTGAKYVVYGPELVQRQLAASHTVEITFPFKSSTSSTAATARTGVASFVLDFDVATGAMTAASGKVSTPNFPR